MSDPKPWHDAPACAHCGLRVMVPFYATAPHRAVSVTRIRCAACGRDCDVDDYRRLAWAWWSQGAEDGRRAVERDGDG